MQMYGPRQESRTLPWAKCQIFLEALFMCNNINTKQKKSIHSYHSFKPLFLFFQIFTSSLKKFEKEKCPKAGYLPLLLPNTWASQEHKYLKHDDREPVAIKKMTLGQVVPNFTGQVVSSKILRIFR